MNKTAAAALAAALVALYCVRSDSAPSARALLKGARLEPVAPVGSAGPVEEPPDDLRGARARWGIAAQLAALREGHGTPASAFTFAVIGDVEPGRFIWTRPWSPGKDAFKKQLRAIQGQGADLLMQLGDFVSKGTVKNYRGYVSFLEAELKMPMFHVIGNHDRSKPNGEADKGLYRTVFGEETDFFFDYNGWRFVGVDSSDYKMTPAQLEWLDKTLDTELPKLIFMHIPPAYLKGKIQSIGPAQVAPQFLPNGYFNEGSERFGEIVRERKVTRVYMGHIHAFGVGEHEGVRYVLTAGGGSPLYPTPPGYPTRKKAHYLLLRADGGNLRETVHELDGTVFPISW